MGVQVQDNRSSRSEVDFESIPLFGAFEYQGTYYIKVGSNSAVWIDQDNLSNDPDVETFDRDDQVIKLKSSVQITLE